ncbi:MAG: hypothetical protein K6C10_02045 [Prevotella sp.]|nr:hypothetical protein [Prevotella sp.]
MNKKFVPSVANSIGIRTCTILVVLLFSLNLQAQEQRVVVADAYTHEPVVRASLYTKEGGRFQAAISDEDGVAIVRFPFRRMTISHLNYEQQQVRQLPDTLWMKPRYQQTAEVVVTNKEPEWIRRKLKRAAKLKDQHYFSKSDTLAFSYETESIDKRSLYRYHLTGLMRMRDADHSLYAILPDSSLIVSSDSTKLTDVTNLRRMLSEDFMAELTNSFIKDHRWAEDPEYEGRSRGEVELVFRSKNRTDDRGRLVLDTARCVVLSAYRFTGTETNRHERMPMALYAMARVLSGYKVNKWTRFYRVNYRERDDGTFYPETVNYKLYMETQDAETDKDQEAYEQQIGGGFPNMEAKLSISKNMGSLSSEDTNSENPDMMEGETATRKWEELPRSWYLRYGTEESRKREVELANLPAVFQLY